VLWLVVGLVLFFLLAVVLPFAARRIADWLWYRDVGFERVFLTKIVAQWTLGLGVGVIAALVLYVNVRLALRGAVLDELLAETRFRPEARARAAVLTRLAEITAKPGALILAFLVAISAASQWRTAIAYFCLTGRWDRHIVPLPFGRLRVEQSEPLAVAAGQPVRPLLLRLQATLDEVASRAGG